MNISTPTLFDAPVTTGTSRRNDRETSKAAARAKDPGPDQMAVLDALRANGGRGTLDTACAALPHRDRGCISRRLTDLEVGGFIRCTDDTELGSRGRQIAVWEVVGRG